MTEKKNHELSIQRILLLIAIIGIPTALMTLATAYLQYKKEKETITINKSKDSPKVDTTSIIKGTTPSIKKKTTDPIDKPIPNPYTENFLKQTIFNCIVVDKNGVAVPNVKVTSSDCKKCEVTTDSSGKFIMTIKYPIEVEDNKNVEFIFNKKGVISNKWVGIHLSNCGGKIEID